MLAPAIARPLSGVLGRPLAALLGTPGQLGRENSMRSPRRTAQTASALMVGLALVSAMAVFGASLSEAPPAAWTRRSAPTCWSRPTAADSSATPCRRRRRPCPGSPRPTTVYRNQFEFRSTLATLTGVTPQNLADTVILRMTAGSAAALGQGELLIDSTTAKTDHLSVGDTAPVRFAYTGLDHHQDRRDLPVQRSYPELPGQLRLLPRPLQAAAPGAVLLRTDGSPGVETAVASALAPYADVQVQTRAQFEQAQVANVNQLLGLVYALLALAVLIALIGIVNTLMLSVLERTGEIGLLRAVGMRRPQVRAMIRSEAVILATFGALIGIVIGTLMGLALVSALRQQGITETSVPWVRLVEFLILAGVLGLVAASWPARRAARLDVLAAIAAQ